MRQHAAAVKLCSSTPLIGLLCLLQQQMYLFISFGAILIVCLGCLQSKLHYLAVFLVPIKLVFFFWHRLHFRIIVVISKKQKRQKQVETHGDEIAAGNLQHRSAAFRSSAGAFCRARPSSGSRWPSSLYSRWFPQEPTSLLRNGQKMCLEGTR